MNSKIIFILLFLFALETTFAQKRLKLDKIINTPLMAQPLSITFTDSLEIISGDVFQYRKKGSNDTWSNCPAEATGTHNISWKKNKDGKSVYYAVGTNKNQLLKFDDINRIPRVFTTEEIPELLRPHDILFNPRDGYFYVINSDGVSEKKYLLRFKDLDKGYEKLDLTSIIPHKDYAYARAITLYKNKIYIVLSSYGEVIRINDFEKGTYTYLGYKDRKPAAAGSFSKTGNVLNDVAYYKGYWYGTNFFCNEYGKGTDINEFRFIRWKSWKDFEDEKYEDMSFLIHENEVPYFISINDGKMYVATFSEDSSLRISKPSESGKIYVLQE